ncbi:MAG: amidohydrolase family protein [Acidipropionibacterium sp.]|nr:amidohydrolase family protein [Acidipropionibacterium sp.]
MDVVSPEELVALMDRARDAGLRPAVHAIGDLAVSTVLDAFDRCGAGGSLEHAQLVDDADLPRFAALGVTASIQPAHLVDDRDATDVIWADRAQRSFRFRDLLDAGARLTMGSDAPVSPVDPWLAIRVAVERTGDCASRLAPGAGDLDVGGAVGLHPRRRSRAPRRAGRSGRPRRRPLPDPRRRTGLHRLGAHHRRWKGEPHQLVRTCKSVDRSDGVM